MFTSPPLSLPNWHRQLLHAFRLPFWFACFWAVAGVLWRPPLASIALICIFLVLLVAVEWGARRLLSTRQPLVESEEPADTKPINKLFAALNGMLSLRLKVRKAETKCAKQKRPVYTGVQDEGIRQQIVRSKTAEGLDRLDGTFWVEFPADAKTVTVHIPFCPAFERVPQVQVFPVKETDDPEKTVPETDTPLRIVSAKTYGVRIDVKRNHRKIDQLCFAIIAEEQ